MEHITLVILIVVFTVYIVVGGVVFNQLEEPSADQIQESYGQIKLDFLGRYQTWFFRDTFCLFYDIDLFCLLLFSVFEGSGIDIFKDKILY